MSKDSNINPIEVGEQTTMAGAEEAIRHNAQMEQQAKLVEAGVEAEKNQLQSEDPNIAALAEELGEDAITELTESSQPVAKGSTEGAVYGDVAAEAVGGAVLKTIKTAADAVQELKDPGKFGGLNTMEDLMNGKAPTRKMAVASKDILGNAVKKEISNKLGGEKSIFTGHFNDLSGRSKILSEFMSGEDKVKGVRATETEVAALGTRQELQMTAQLVSARHLGNAIQKKANLGAENHKAQQAGMVPGGSTVRAPKAPTHMTDEETGVLT